MMWGRKKEEKVFAVKLKQTVITINLDGMADIDFAHPLKEGMKRTEPWRKFYKWWFGRTSESFVFSYNKGECVILRKRITGFNVALKGIGE